MTRKLTILTKITASVLGTLLFVAPAYGFSTLWEYFNLKGQTLPPISERAVLYQDAGFSDIYSGTAEQNESLLSAFIGDLNFGSLAPPPATVEGTSTAGWTDDGSNVRLNTSSDFVGIGTANPVEKLTIYGGNIYNSGSISLSGGTITFGSVNNGTSTLSVANSGNLGVGTTTPTSTLSVHGNLYVAGTSTVGKFNAASSTFAANGVNYNWPSSQGAAASVLSNNGSGALSWAANTSASFQPIASTQVLNGSTCDNTGWTDVQLGTVIGTTSSLAIVSVDVTGNPYAVLFRPNGSSASTTGGIGAIESDDPSQSFGGMAIVKTDSSGIIERKCLNNLGGTPTLNLFVEGYWTAL